MSFFSETLMLMKNTLQFAGRFGAGLGVEMPLADGMRPVAAQRAISTDIPEVHRT